MSLMIVVSLNIFNRSRKLIGDSRIRRARLAENGDGVGIYIPA